MKIRLIFLISLFVALQFPKTAKAQSLTSGFDKSEYREMLLISARSTADSAYYNLFPKPMEFTMVYQSAEMGLDNMWDLWTNKKGTAVISIRGTTVKAESWLANFYAAMVPAKGELKLSATDVFKYELAQNPKAAVHVGWLLSTAYLSRDMLPKIDSCYKIGIRNIIIMGHSQGGAISYLLTSYLNDLQKKNTLPADIRFKTYISAGPKPGNLYYAYDFESECHDWALNVVNTADWVPETPISIQTLHDFNTTNPFINAEETIKKQRFPKNLVMKHVFKKLDKPTRKAQHNYEKYLGEMTSKLLKSSLPEFVPPTYYESNHYVRTGTIIVLRADEAYYKLYPDKNEKIFGHHGHEQYLYLLEKLP